MTWVTHHLLSPWRALTASGSDWHWLFLASTAGIAFIIYMTRRVGPCRPAEFFRWLFPRAIYAHPSVRLDIAVFILNTSLLALPSATIAAAVGSSLRDMLAVVFGPAQAAPSVLIWANVVFTLTLVICGDFALFASHRVMHASAILWEFHKVHHSAPVLTPLSAYRRHPVEEFLTGCFNGLTVGIAGGLFLYLSGGTKIIDLAGHNVVEFAALVAARHLRHSHIAVSFGPRLEKILVSPAMHQLHHSSAPEYTDRNFGQIFSIWDRLCGTFHHAVDKTHHYGICGAHGDEFATLQAIYLSPLITILKILRQRRSAEL